MFGLGLPETLIVLAIILVLFGPKRLPDLARGIGKSVTEFRKGVREPDEEKEQA